MRLRPEAEARGRAIPSPGPVRVCRLTRPPQLLCMAKSPPRGAEMMEPGQQGTRKTRLHLLSHVPQSSPLPGRERKTRTYGEMTASCLLLRGSTVWQQPQPATSTFPDKNEFAERLAPSGSIRPAFGCPSAASASLWKALMAKAGQEVAGGGPSAQLGRFLGKRLLPRTRGDPQTGPAHPRSPELCTQHHSG